MFGSILTDRFNDDSDVDLVVSFNKAEVSDYFDNYFDFKYSLEELLGRDVDLLEEQTIKNPYLKRNVDATKALIYGCVLSFSFTFCCSLQLLISKVNNILETDNEIERKSFWAIYIIEYARTLYYIPLFRRSMLQCRMM